MKHLILIGACYLDTILTVPEFPEEDSKLRATSLKVRRGGNCPNTLEVLQQLISTGPSCQSVKLRPHLISCLPSASATATRNILSSFGENPLVDFTRCLYREKYDEPASSYIIRSEKTGSRTIVNFNDLPEMTAGEFQEIVPAFSSEYSDGNETWWHFEGRIPETTLQCIRHLRQVTPKSRISVEVEKPNREGLVEIAAEADVVFYSKTWAESRGYNSPEACLRGEAKSSRASLMFCTWGAGGAGVLRLSGGGEYFHVPAIPTGQQISVVDTIGAGDTFIAGALYALHIEGWGLEAKLAFAVGLATTKVQKEGFADLTR
ncbi:Ketohexokinase [Cladorrhinum samala]|uniref:Ketohexokinase n=1 Tax=Cladorrhinum samala TaxID=585594 RepID=A0AAV9HAE4_9PEZI|nr:Ketohexokinase [Cladorrhinum samala]